LVVVVCFVGDCVVFGVCGMSAVGFCVKVGIAWVIGVLSWCSGCGGGMMLLGCLLLWMVFDVIFCLGGGLEGGLMVVSVINGKMMIVGMFVAVLCVDGCDFVYNCAGLNMS